MTGGLETASRFAPSNTDRRRLDTRRGRSSGFCLNLCHEPPPERYKYTTTPNTMRRKRETTTAAAAPPLSGVLFGLGFADTDGDGEGAASPPDFPAFQSSSIDMERKVG